MHSVFGYVWLAVCELGTDFYLPLFLTHDLIHEYERCFHVGSLTEVIPIFSLCICAFDCENEMKWTINRFPWWNQESRKKDGQPLDNHHRSNKSMRFIANGGFEYIYLAILFGFSIHSTVSYTWSDSNLYESFNQYSDKKNVWYVGNRLVKRIKKSIFFFLFIYSIIACNVLLDI